MDSIIRSIIKTYFEVGQSDEDVVRNLSKRISSENTKDLEELLVHFTNLVEVERTSARESKENLKKLKRAIKENTTANDMYDKIIKVHFIDGIVDKNVEELEAIELCSKYLSATVNHVKAHGIVSNRHVKDNELALEACLMAKKPDLSRNFSTSSSSDVGESFKKDPQPPIPITRRLSDLARRFGIA
jgi:hypothetical protein